MPKKIDIGNLTADETKELAIECLSALSLHDRVQVVLATFTTDERDELESWIYDEKE